MKSKISFIMWTLEWILFFAILTTALFHAYSYRTYSIDDSAICFRFAENLANGHGLKFNRGMPATEGYTNFLWTIMLVPSFILKIDPMVFSKNLGQFFLTVTMLSVFLLGRSILKLPFLALLPLILMAANPSLAIWVISGLEPVMFAGLLFAGVTLFYFGQQKGGRCLHAASAICFSMLILTRPDAIMFFGIFSCFIAMHIYAGGMKKEYLVWFSITLSVLILYVAWRLYYFGSLLPNTYFVKGTGSASSREVGASNFTLLLNLDYNRLILYLSVPVSVLYSIYALFWGKIPIFSRIGIEKRITPC
ncbi:MAG: hypothetical protein HQK54_13655, partial [Oligoflexales bacterium]|nr:hypothetical protein [Oligoflexales bacterium]